MISLSRDIIHFFQNQEFAIVSTLNSDNKIHCSAKGIIEIEPEGKMYLIDLYRSITLKNLQNDPTISITAIDSHQFIGYTLQGKAEIVERGKIKESAIAIWEQKIIKRISNRVIKNIKVDRAGFHQPEVKFPTPKHLIEVTVESVVDLAPAHLKNIS